MRLSQLLGLAGGVLPATYAGRAHIERWNRADSTRRVVAVTLPRDSAAPWIDDPALQEFDIVTVYGRPEMRDTLYVAIAGMVNRPGRFPWREGMTLRDLVLMARGTRPGAYLLEAEIARLPVDRTQGQMATTQRVTMDSTYLFDRDSLGRYIGPPGMPFPASGAPEVPLQMFDNVLILRQPDFELQRTVQILGEVRFPGAYSLRTKDEKLADVIARAGGLTPRAYPQGIRFFRILNDAGRINIDLPRALREPQHRSNVILQPGDSIIIPEYIPSVRVAGAVNTPGSVLWQPGASLSYYIDGAGGFARNADKGGASVRQPDGLVRRTNRVLLLFRNEPEPGPGSEIFVPARERDDRVDYVALFGGIAQTLASIIAIVVLVTQ
jgi:protein involved in polysaccharide export with SLBB domain